MEPKNHRLVFSLLQYISQHIKPNTRHFHTRKKSRKLRKPNSSDQTRPDQKTCVQMGCQESDFGCEKHSGHSQQQQQGICPACLRERLLYLASIQSCTTTTTTSSCSSSPSSSSPRLPPPCYSPASTSSSACASPPHRRRASDFSCSIGFIIGEGTGGGNNGLSKSRSVAFVANARGRKKKGGFWSKLLRLPGKRTKEAFGHSRNFKEGFEYYNY